MKGKLLTVLCCMVMVFAANTNSSAQAILIHYWNFNNNTVGAMYTPTITPVSADYTRVATTGNGVLYTGLYGMIGNVGSYIDTLTSVTADFDTINLRSGATSGQMMRARNNSDSMELLFYIPSTNYYNLLLTYGTESSSTTSGMLQQNYSYSNDSGNTWITSGPGLSTWSYAPTDTFTRASVHFMDIASKNNKKLVFRITFTGNTHSTAAKGNNRFDNITLEGDTISSTNTTGIEQITSAPAYTMAPNPVTNILHINSDMDGEKSIIICNVTGQTVYTSNDAGKSIYVNTSLLNSGNYYITIRESATGRVSTMKFVKQ